MTSVLFTPYSMSGFQQKATCKPYQKTIKNSAEEIKQASEPNSGITLIWIYQTGNLKKTATHVKDSNRKVDKTCKDRWVM